jgi:hypothetical protein
MPGLIDYLPDAESLLALGPEDLGMILLELLQQDRQPRVALSNIEMPLWTANTPTTSSHARGPGDRGGLAVAAERRPSDARPRPAERLVLLDPKGRTAHQQNRHRNLSPMRAALNPKDGVLTDMSAVAGERLR